MAIVPKEANKTISHAELTCCYYRNANTTRFDSISLTEEPCQTYKYNSEGNLTSVKSTGNGSETYNYNSTTQNLMSVGTEGIGTFHYEYSSGQNKHLPVRVTNDSTSMAVTYDPYGEAIQTKLSNTKDSKYMESHASYENGLMKSQIDNAGTLTAYAYNDKRERYKVTDAAGHAVETHLDSSFGRVKENFQSGGGLPWITDIPLDS